MSFTAYPEYKSSGFDWLTEVPAHWGDRKIARDIPFVVGWTPPSGKDEYYDGDLPWVTIADMTQMSVEDTKSKISHLAVQDKGAKIVPAGSMLFSFKLSVGKIAFLTFDSYTNEAIAGFLPCKPLDLEYWKYAAPEFIPRYGRENIYGATLLNQELISSVRFSAPARAEQAQIARFLDYETARIDALIEEQQRLIELLKEKRQAVISHAVTKGLDPTVPMKDSDVVWLGEVPAHWSVVPFGLAFGYQEGPGIMAVDFKDEGVPLVRISGVQGRWVTLQGCNYLDPAKASGKWGHFRLEYGDLIISGSASMGLVSEVGEEAVGAVAYTGLIRLTPKKGISDRDFIRSVVGSYQFFVQIDLLKAGSTIQHFGPTHLSQMKVVLPPLDEQIKLACYVDKVSIQFDQLLGEAEQTNELLQERRAALISAAVTGKIDVRGWQPPACAPTPELKEAV